MRDLRHTCRKIEALEALVVDSLDRHIQSVGQATSASSMRPKEWVHPMQGSGQRYRLRRRRRGGL